MFEACVRLVRKIRLPERGWRGHRQIAVDFGGSAADFSSPQISGH